MEEMESQVYCSGSCSDGYTTAHGLQETYFPLRFGDKLDEILAHFWI
jgi:hypothetical protein